MTVLILRLISSEKLLNILNLRDPTILRKTLQEDLPVLLLQDPIIQQREQPTVIQRPDQPSKPLLQRYHRRRHLVLKERVSAILFDGVDARRHHRIVGHGERQPIDDDATEL